MPTFPCSRKNMDFNLFRKRLFDQCDLKKSVNRFNIHVQPPKIKCRKVVGAYKAYQVIRYTEASKYRVARSMRNATSIPTTWNPSPRGKNHGKSSSGFGIGLLLFPKMRKQGIPFTVLHSTIIGVAITQDKLLNVFRKQGGLNSCVPDHRTSRRMPPTVRICRRWRAGTGGLSQASF